MIQFRSVSKVFRTQGKEVLALTDVSFQIEPGEFVAVRGASGSGKSTLLALAGGLTTATGGEVEVLGELLGRLSPARRAALRAEKIGFVFQMFHLLPYLSVRDNVLVAGTDAAAAGRRSDALLDQFGLADRLHHRPAELSIGERQRVAMARALLNQPELVLADEPTGNLDAENAAILLDALEQYRDRGGTILMVTHDERAAARAQRSLTLEQGRLTTPAVAVSETS